MLQRLYGWLDRAGQMNWDAIPAGVIRCTINQPGDALGVGRTKVNELMHVRQLERRLIGTIVAHHRRERFRRGEIDAPRRAKLTYSREAVLCCR
jgi:hypothetical protein